MNPYRLLGLGLMVASAVLVLVLLVELSGFLAALAWRAFEAWRG